jgi:hypothetical protein
MVEGGKGGGTVQLKNTYNGVEKTAFSDEISF